MDQQKMPWEEDWSAPAAQAPSPITIPVNDPVKAMSVPRAGNDLIEQGQRIQRGVAQAPYLAGQAADEAAIRHSQAVKSQQEVEDAAAAKQAATMSANSNVHGDAYLRAYVPPAQWGTVRALARGDLGARNGISKTLLPLLQHAMNFDPTMTGTSFPARQAMQIDLAKGDMGKSVRSLDQALGHAGHMVGAIGGLDNYRGILSPLNYVKTPVESFFGDGRITGFNEARQNFTGEVERTFLGTAGTKDDRGQREANLSAYNSPDANMGTIRTDVAMMKSRIDALNDQYRRTMGTDIRSLLSPDAQASYDNIMSGAWSGGAAPPAAHPGAGASPSPGGLPPAGGPGSMPPGAGPGGGATTIATGATRTLDNGAANGVINSMIRAGASDGQIAAALKPLGYDFTPQTARQVSSSRAYLKAHPDFQGSFGGAQREVPTTAWNRFVASPTGTAVLGAVDGAMGGTSDEAAGLLGAGDTADLNARKQALFALNPKSAILGQTAGTIGTLTGIGAAGRATGLTGWLGVNVPRLDLLGNVAFGAASGAGQDNDDRLTGALAGGVGGLLGHGLGVAGSSVVGRVGRTPAGQAMVSRIGGMFGANPIAQATKLRGADQIIVDAARKGGVDNITSSLTEAQRLGLPMTLADTSSNLRELTGAAVRRSPSASTIAEDALLARGRGQYDRFTSAVQRDLGPTVNIPQQSADLMTRARAAAGSLYDRAYAQPVPHTPELEAVLNTPFGRQAVSRAETIAANERRSPTELGFAQDANGNTVLNPQPGRQMADHLDARAELDAAQQAYRDARRTPGANMTAAANQVEKARQTLRQAQAAVSAAPDPGVAASVPSYTTQTLDYVKRGMDDVLEDGPRLPNGKLIVDEAGRAKLGVRAQLLNEVDRLNPTFAEARRAYAGPASAREALERGQDAYSLHPDELGMQVAAQSPEHLGQMQLGYRGALVDHAGRVRDASNPFDATLGSPVARDRLGTIYPDDPGVANLLRQSELEKQMAGTTNAVLGNSRTARNQIADQAFATNPLVEGAMHAGAAVATHGASVPGTAARLAGLSLRDRMTFGLGQHAVAKADDIAPVLLNTDSKAALEALQALLARDDGWKTFVAQTTPKRLGGMFGVGVGGDIGAASQNR